MVAKRRYACVCVYMCMCVCVCERERERERDSQYQAGKKTDSVKHSTDIKGGIMDKFMLRI
jgi:hypothetical protein